MLDYVMPIDKWQGMINVHGLVLRHAFYMLDYDNVFFFWKNDNVIII